MLACIISAYNLSYYNLEMVDSELIEDTYELIFFRNKLLECSFFFIIIIFIE
jgi:hypothetical protein